MTRFIHDDLDYEMAVALSDTAISAAARALADKYFTRLETELRAADRAGYDYLDVYSPRPDLPTGPEMVTDGEWYVARLRMQCVGSNCPTPPRPSSGFTVTRYDLREADA